MTRLTSLSRHRVDPQDNDTHNGHQWEMAHSPSLGALASSSSATSSPNGHVVVFKDSSPLSSSPSSSPPPAPQLPPAASTSAGVVVNGTVSDVRHQKDYTSAARDIGRGSKNQYSDVDCLAKSGRDVDNGTTSTDSVGLVGEFEPQQPQHSSSSSPHQQENHQHQYQKQQQQHYQQRQQHEYQQRKQQQQQQQQGLRISGSEGNHPDWTVEGGGSCGNLSVVSTPLLEAERERNRQGSNHGPFASEADVLPQSYRIPQVGSQTRPASDAKGSGFEPWRFMFYPRATAPPTFQAASHPINDRLVYDPN
ncbi:hypothetical protein EGW08_012191 [Elysia chlorotica]|uniref:Uncharacterized protein n=1 Tax=Elysia chlorotica TaxID=188477 RepID=A0A433TET9_ELYCH|nr:hypothetical protein EGW08_012191 [Elysia chlorotica]